MDGFPMKIYENSPICFQNLLTTIEGYRKTKNRYGHTYFRLLKELDRRDCTNDATEKEYQLQALKKLIAFAVKNSPFYKEFYEGINLDNIQTIEDLKTLPILENDLLKTSIASMYTMPEDSAIISHTLDCTGTPLKFRIAKEDMQRHMAFLDVFKKQHGAINLEMKRASFSSNRFIPKKQQKKLFWRDNHYSKQRLYSAYYCNQENAKEFVGNLDKYQPDFIDGLPSAIYELAKYINREKIILSFKPIAIFSNTEKLTSKYRKEIEEAFDCPVRNHYSFLEGAPLITECAKGNYHYNPRSGIIETNDNKEMIITGFNTYGTPLIRYNTGELFDFLANEHCGCECNLPVLKEIQSHEDTFLQSRSRGKFTALYSVLANSHYSHAIRKVRFTENSPKTIDVMIEATDSFNNTMTDSIHAELVYIFGEEMRFTIRMVEKIPLNKTMKYSLVIDNLN